MSTYIIAAVPSSARGTVTPGMMVAQALRRNRKITITTSAMVRARVNSTSRTEALMVVVRFATVSTLIDGGTDASACGSNVSTRFSASMTLAPGCLKISSKIPLRPFCHAVSSLFSGPSTATPTSRMRTGAPFL